MSWDTPRKSKLRQQNKNQKRQIDRLHKAANINKHASTETFNDFLSANDIALPEKLKMFISTQLALHKENCKAPRYSDAFKQFALMIYFHGPKVYRMLSNVFKLPTYRCLIKITENWPSYPGFNPILFEALPNILKKRIRTALSASMKCL